MSVTAFGDLPLAGRDREWDGDAAEKRVRRWADAQDNPNAKYRDAHVWYDADNKDNFGAYKLLIRCGRRETSGSAARSDGRRRCDAGLARRRRPTQRRHSTRVKSHLAKYYKKLGDSAPWDRD